MAFVADASIALAWYFRDEDSATANRVRDRLIDEGVCVPAHWPLEVVNALLAALRRNRIDEQELRQLLEDFRRLPDLIDEQTGASAWSKTAELALQYGLTSYDAAYLELALRLELPLATLDKTLANAALSAGGRLVPEIGLSGSSRA